MKKILTWSGNNLETLMQEISNSVDNFVAKVDDRGNLHIWSDGSREVVVALGEVILIEDRKIKKCCKTSNAVKI